MGILEKWYRGREPEDGEGQAGQHGMQRTPLRAAAEPGPWTDEREMNCGWEPHP